MEYGSQLGSTNKCLFSTLKSFGIYFAKCITTWEIIKDKIFFVGLSKGLRKKTQLLVQVLKGE